MRISNRHYNMEQTGILFSVSVDTKHTVKWCVCTGRCGKDCHFYCGCCGHAMHTVHLCRSLSVQSAYMGFVRSPRCAYAYVVLCVRHTGYSLSSVRRCKWHLALLCGGFNTYLSYLIIDDQNGHRLHDEIRNIIPGSLCRCC